MRLVLYAEGSGETAGGLGLPRTPGTEVDDDDLGAAHLLIRRSVALVAGQPEASIRFQEGLRPGGRRAVGSALYGSQRAVRQLLAFVKDPPDAVFFLLDRDGVVTTPTSNKREEEVRSWVTTTTVPVEVLVAREEFEAWLVADPPAAAKAARRQVLQPPAVDSLGPGEAKALLATWCENHSNPAAVRRTIAESVDLDRLKAQCRSYAAALNSVRSLVERIGR